MRNTKLVTELVAGQRYSEYDPTDMDREVFTFRSVETNRQDGFTWLNYTDQDGVPHREVVPSRFGVYPVGPAGA